MFPENFRENKYSIVIIILIYSILSIIMNGLGWNLCDNLIVSGEGQLVGYPTRLFSAKFSLWNPYVQCGTFNYKDIGFQQLYPVNLIITLLLPNFLGYNISLLLHYVLAGSFTYIFCGKLKLNPTASFIGGLCFMFCGFMMSHRGHQTMIHAAIWLPLILYFVERFFESKRYRELIFAAVAFSMSILADYTAMPMYIGMVVFPYIIMKVCIENREIKYYIKIKNIVTYALILFGIGLLLSSISIIPIAESLKYLTRDNIDYKFFSSYSFRWKFIPLILFPYFYGTHTPGFYPVEYFGRWNLMELTGYMGIIPLVAAFVCFFHYRKKDIHIFFWGIVAAFAFILVLGHATPFYKLMFHVPVYNMFRAPARNWYEVHFAIVMLFSYFIHYIMSEKDISSELSSKIKKAVIYLAVAFAIIILIVVVVRIASVQMNLEGPSSWMLKGNSNPGNALEQVNQFVINTRLFPPSSVIYIPFIITVISILFLMVLKKHYKHKKYWIILSIFLFFDLGSFGFFHDSKYGESAFLKNIERNKLYNFFRKNETDLKNFRLYPVNHDFNLLYPEINMLYGLSAINGYSAIWLKNYADLTTFKAAGDSDNYQALLSDPRIISSLSVKYILTSDENKKNFLSSIAIDKNTLKTCYNINLNTNNLKAYIKRFETDSGEAIFENRFFLPRARFIENVINADNIDEIARKFKEPDFNPCTTVFVESLKPVGSYVKGRILESDFSNNECVNLKVSTEGKAFLVLADTFYPGWSAFIDDVKTEIYRVNGVVRGIIIPDKGNHKIIFLFKPKSFYIGIIVSILSLFLFVVFLIYLSFGRWVLKKIFNNEFKNK